MARYTEDDILGALDDAQGGECWQWPDFEHPDYRILTTRMMVYRDDARWAILICTVEWSSDTFLSVTVMPVGNCVQIPQPENYDALLADYIEQELEDRKETREDYPADMWKEMGADGPDSGAKFERKMRESFAVEADYIARRPNIVEFDYDFDNDKLEDRGFVSEVCIRGKRIALSKLKIERRQELGFDKAFCVGVAVTEEYRDEIMPLDTELAPFFSGDVPSKFLTLEEWHHSRYGLASEWQVFQLLAKAIIKGDRSVYQPTEEPNTNWRNWINK